MSYIFARILVFTQASEDEALNTAEWLFASKCRNDLHEAEGGEEDSEYSWNGTA